MPTIERNDDNVSVAQQPVKVGITRIDPAQPIPGFVDYVRVLALRALCLSSATFEAAIFYKDQTPAARDYEPDSWRAAQIDRPLTIRARPKAMPCTM